MAVTFDTDETDATKILLQGLVQGPQPSRSTLLQISHQYQPPRDPSSLRIPDYLVLVSLEPLFFIVLRVNFTN